MKNIPKTDLIIISGGNPVVAAAVTGAVIYTGVASVFDATQTFHNIGQSAGEFVYNITNPDPLGQMVYSAEDFPK